MLSTNEGFSINSEPVYFHDLPAIAQVAAKDYYFNQLCLDEVSLDSQNWYHGIISTKLLMDFAAKNEGFDSAEEYHAWYSQSDMPDHGDSIWPVLLDRNEVIWDGWHRFHSYYSKGIDLIPFYATHDVSALFSPKNDAVENDDDHAQVGPR